MTGKCLMIMSELNMRRQSVPNPLSLYKLKMVLSIVGRTRSSVRKRVYYTHLAQYIVYDE